MMPDSPSIPCAKPELAQVSAMPQRIQRRRTAGWRMPAGAIYVGRPSIWGNPWVVHVHTARCGPDHLWCPLEIRAELRGRDLVCWCPLDQPCHADVLLELANQEVPA